MTQILRLCQHQIYEGDLILVNSNHKIHIASPLSLFPIYGHPNILFKKSALIFLNALMNKINGWEQIVPVSAWRSRQEQEEIWTNSRRDNGLAFTQSYVARPDCSEHQTGLAIDLGVYREHMDFIRPDFPNTGICGEFRKYAVDYGFIERYPKGKESITGIAHEPWHFRFVGIPHARIMTHLGLTLEQYHEFIQHYSPQRPYQFDCGSQRFTLFYLPGKSQGDITLRNPAEFSYTFSGDNCGGFIITQWRKSHV